MPDAFATSDQGLMSFRVSLPLSRGQEFGKAAADGQPDYPSNYFPTADACHDEERDQRQLEGNDFSNARG